ncbi:hypothetical protein Bmyc01_53340 [Bacillus mycoides]|nr:hypothetical protein Bmyc01_53340 [Bacillus mycoides]
MKGNLTYYFILYPLIFFLVYALSPILFDKEEYTSMKDILGMIVTYYILISGYYFIDCLSERINKNGKEKQ